MQYSLFTDSIVTWPSLAASKNKLHCEEASRRYTRGCMEIDPNVLNIILGLITNGLTSLLASSGHKAGELLIGKEFLEKWEVEKTTLAPLLHSAISQVAETAEWKG